MKTHHFEQAPQPSESLGHRHLCLKWQALSASFEIGVPALIYSGGEKKSQKLYQLSRILEFYVFVTPEVFLEHA